MRRTYANLWSQAAAGLTAISHTRASMFRWGVLVVLVAVWMWAGLTVWGSRGPLEAVYRTISAVGMYDDYFNVEHNDLLEIARFAGIVVPIVGLLFAFSGALGRSLAQSFNLGAAKHVVIAGATPPALSLALDCRLRAHDAVILIGDHLAADTALGLRRRGVIVVEGDATRVDTLTAARAHHAAHVVAFMQDDTANLQIEAAVRRLVGDGRRRPPIGMHVATHSSMLLRESREMRSQLNRRRSQERAESVDSKPFSLNEMIGRALVQSEAHVILDLAEQVGHERVHVLVFGFDEAAEASVVRFLMSMWSVKFGAPRFTVLTKGAERAEARFRTRHAHAFAHPHLWTADIAFFEFDWETAAVGAALIEHFESARGKPTAAIVATGADPENIQMSIALLRVANLNVRWPMPIYMREQSISEFSREYARGDTTEELDAYLQAFGAHQYVATRARILDGAIDRGAAIAHEHYNKHLGDRDAMSMRELQAAMKHWDGVLETYRAANRAVADSCLVKLWDAGWRPAKPGETGETAPVIAPDLLEPLARREHDRWMAERLLSGWQPAEKRHNDSLHHDKLVPWDALNEDDRARDVVQVRAAVDVARILHPRGFLRRS